MHPTLRAEIVALLDADTTDLGQVWRLLAAHTPTDAIAQQLVCTPGHVSNVRLQAQVLLGAPLPSAPSLALKCAQKAGGWLRDKQCSAALTDHLNEIRRKYARLVDGEHVYPAIEYVKRPVDRVTGEPTGEAIRKRHLPGGCTHFWPDPVDPTRLLGEPLRLATDEEMKLEPCKHCQASSDRAGFPARGPRSEVPDQDVQPDGSAKRPVFADTDRQGSVTLRREQAALRAALLAGRDEAPCLLCGRTLPKALLVAAHIVPRRDLTHDERLNFSSAAFLACSLGCDALFELGYVVVDASGTVARGRVAVGALEAAVKQVVGRQVGSVCAGQATQFAAHAQRHTGITG